MKWRKCNNIDCDWKVHPIFFRRYNGHCSPKCETITNLRIQIIKLQLKLEIIEEKGT